jgi:hypothetical protein
MAHSPTGRYPARAGAEAIHLDPVAGFAPGRTLVRRILHPDDRIATLQSGRVVEDDERGLLLWVGPGSTTVRRTRVSGEPTRDLPYLDELRLPTVLQPVPAAFPVLILTPRGASHSVSWWFDEHGRHTAWYVNLEAPAVRWRGGIDVRDHALDAIVRPDHTWEWKDEDEFAARTGQPPFWDAGFADRIRAEGMRLREAVQAKDFPFDGTWCDFAPDPAWPPSALPRWWDQPAAPATCVWDPEFFA